MVLAYFFIALIVSLVNLAILKLVLPRRVNSFYPTLFSFITISLIGHIFLALSSNIEELLLANKLIYFGAAFMPLFLFMGVLNLCQVKLSFWKMILFFMPSIVVYAAAATAGFSTLYYETVTLVHHYGITDFTATYGPAHILFNILMSFYLVSGLSILFYSFTKKKNISYRTLMYVVLIGFLSIASFFVAREVGTDVIVMPAIYIIDEIILLLIIHRIGRYDIDGTIMNSLAQLNTNAYISFAKDYRYIGCNDIALKYFPVLKDFRVDQTVPNDSPESTAFNNLLQQFNDNDLSKILYFQIEKKHYKCLIRHLLHGEKKCGYLLRIEDDTKLQRYIKMLDKYNEELATDVQNKNYHIQAMQEQMIVGVANMVENRDSSTGGHIKRTSQVVRILVNEMRRDEHLGLTNSFCQAVIKAAPMHDLGKIAVDDKILRKPGKFTEDEFEIMKTHAEKGAAIVENLLRDIEPPELVNIAKNVAHYHHELWSGGGYPKGLRREEIPLEARIMAIADVYDALVSQRCYKESISCDDAFDIILSSMGTHFDPGLKTYFVNCKDELKDYYDSILAGERATPEGE